MSKRPSRRHPWQAGPKKAKAPDRPAERRPDREPDWNRECENCGAKPVVPSSGLCGPCTFGEADTAGGNW